MPAPGTVWDADTWDADAWAADTWAEAEEGATGQTPRASRFRYAYQLTDRVRLLLAAIGL